MIFGSTYSIIQFIFFVDVDLPNPDLSTRLEII
jgi:hypothetical protein